MDVLVTGANGFLGRHVVAQLLARGEKVTAFVRRKHDFSSEVETFIGDVRRHEDIQKACENKDVVIHLAAKVGDWGPYKSFYETNVIGTENVIEACRSRQVSKLVYCSTPSVVFDGKPICDGDESLAYPNNYLCAYQKTKAIAEKKVLAANAVGGLVTVALRPHAIWGVGDPHSVSRLLEAARTRKLKIVGDGKNQISMTHVENAAIAHLQAMDSDQVGGKAYFVNDPKPVFLWKWYARILEAAGLPFPETRISFKTAHRLGRLLELSCKFLPIMGRPKITRYVAAVLAKDHSFKTDRAQVDFGFRSIVSVEEKTQELLQWIEKNEKS